MKTIKLLSAASVTMLALGCASAGLSPSSAAAQGYGSAPPPPPSYGPPPPSYQPPSGYDREHDQSMLKVCKVAGEGIKDGEIFAFFAKPNDGRLSVAIPAGPGQGYCQIIGVYPVGTQVDLREQIPNGYVVQSITTEPASAEMSQDLSTGRVMVRLPAGVTEVKVINLPPDKGAIEICKIGGRPGTRYEFSYTDTNGNIQQTQTLANSCTPVIWVRSGQQVITELNANGQMTGGKAYPAWRLVKADPSKSQVIVYIPRGGTSQSQTVVTFENRREGKGY
jgi:hypothetical protein